MARKRKYTVLVALADQVSATYLEQLLFKQTDVNLSVSVLEDVYDVLGGCQELDPDLLIVSPQVISDPMVPVFREALGKHELKIISYCHTLIEAEMTKHFDGKILSTNGEEEMMNLLENLVEMDGAAKEVMALTPREQEVVVAVVKGLTNKEIAEEFYLSTHTVITHRRNIARKLNIHSPSGLTIYAIMNRLVTLEEIQDHI